MNSVYIVTWVNPNDGDDEMCVCATKDIAESFGSSLQDGVNFKIHNRPVQTKDW